jgi:hypothetical protein
MTISYRFEPGEITAALLAFEGITSGKWCLGVAFDAAMTEGGLTVSLKGLSLMPSADGIDATACRREQLWNAAAGWKQVTGAEEIPTNMPDPPSDVPHPL